MCVLRRSVHTTENSARHAAQHRVDQACALPPFSTIVLSSHRGCVAKPHRSQARPKSRLPRRAPTVFTPAAGLIRAAPTTAARSSCATTVPPERRRATADRRCCTPCPTLMPSPSPVSAGSPFVCAAALPVDAVPARVSAGGQRRATTYRQGHIHPPGERPGAIQRWRSLHRQLRGAQASASTPAEPEPPARPATSAAAPAQPSA